MEPKEKKAFEPSGLVPRSIVRTFERFRQQLLPGSETAAIREYRISRYQVLVSARCLFTLLIIPIATNWLVSSWLLSPLVKHFWNTQQNEIFLNSYQEERAFAELESFSEKLFFESLLNTTNTINVDFIPSPCNKNPIPYKGKCYDKNFSSASQSSVTNKFTSDSEAELPLPHANQRFAYPEGVWGMRSKEQNKSSICKIWVAELTPYPKRAFSERAAEEYRSQTINDVVIKSVPIDDYVNCWQILQSETLNHLQAVPAFYKSSIYSARVNSPLFNKAWYSSIFYPTKTSVTELRTEELEQRERNSQLRSTKMNLSGNSRKPLIPFANSFQYPVQSKALQSPSGYGVKSFGYPERAFSERAAEGKGSGVEFVQYEKYLPLPNWENKEQLTLSHNSLTQPLLAPYEVQLRLPFWGILKFSCASSSLLCIPQRDNRSLATLVPWKFHANDANLRFARFAYPIPHTLTGYRGKQIENLHGVRGQQLRNSLPLLPLQGVRSKGSGVVSTNSLLTPLPLQGFSLYPERGKRNWGYIEDLFTPYPERDCKASLCMGYAVTVNNGVKGTEAKAPFLLSVPIESTYDNSLKIKEKVQNKILELAIYYNQQTIISITNIIGDVVSLVTLGCLFIWMKPEITILKSFLIEAIYSLSDTTKSFLLILLTDLLVGFHSPRGWETALELLLKHFGLPENQDFVFLFVATFPVLLDTVFKYWIFRHLNKISPSTVATYHSMIE